MGQVFEVMDVRTGQNVALKVVRPDAAVDPHRLRRGFEREIRLLQTVRHPALMPVLEASAPGAGTLFYTMPLMAGHTLQDRLPLAPAQAAPVFERLTAALTAMHAQRVLHRDIKPANVLFDEAGQAYLADFGLARDEGPAAGPASTVLGGTFRYASPEQITSQPLTPASDVFSLAVLMFQTLTGALPFAEFAQLHDAPRAALTSLNPNLPAELDEVFARALQVNPSARPQSVADLWREVQSGLAPLTQRAGPAPRQPPATPPVSPEALNHLRAWALAEMFIALGWSHPANPRPRPLTLDGQPLLARPLAHAAQVLAFEVRLPAAALPTNDQCRALYRQLPEAEKLLIVRAGDAAVWYWEDNRLPHVRSYRHGQPVEVILPVLAHVQLTVRDWQAGLTVLDVAERLRRALAAEKVTKKFYKDYEAALAPFLKAIKGLSKEAAPAYASTVLNRVMFCYFLQAKGLLPAPDYLQNGLRRAEPNAYYRDFLRPLWFEALGQPWETRPPAIRQAFAGVPYLNGGLFTPLPVEADPARPLAISNEAFAQVFAVLDRYHWHLDDRPSGRPNEINPDVLGFIFEKHINQKQMGAYYTKEDITNYIARNTILPRLLDRLADLHPHALTTLAARLNTHAEAYLFPALTQPDRLPTETDREFAARQRRADLAREALMRVTPADLTRALVTWNVHVEALVRDWLADLHDPLLARAFYFECLRPLSVLDPTVGSGAFLFAALNILYPLYETCLRRFEALASPRYPDFEQELARVRAHPNRAYFILKSIMLNNLYGVDIMPEAVEICKLRLFLKLAAALAPNQPDRLEPLPDIDFNIRAGNALVGFASLDDVAGFSLFTSDLPQRIQAVSRAVTDFRALQTALADDPAALRAAKASLLPELAALQADLDAGLAQHAGARSVRQFVASHQPFHWPLAFYAILAQGGFDVIIGNPPYVEYKEVKDDYQISGYVTESCGNLYAFVYERCLKLLQQDGRLSLIVPSASCGTPRMSPLMDLITDTFKDVWVSLYDERPGKLFDGVDQQLSIHVCGHKGKSSKIFITSMRHWYTRPDNERDSMFQTVFYVPVHSNQKIAGVFPKISFEIEQDILQKIFAVKSLSVLDFQKPEHTGKLFYRNAGGRYWRVIKSTPSGFRSEKGKKSSSTEKELLVPEKYKMVLVSLFSSSLFYWFWRVVSNCRHLTSREIESFPLADSIFSGNAYKVLDDLGRRYEQRLLETKIVSQKNSVYSGEIIQDEYQVSEAKPIIDEIDRVLGAHYGLSEAEVDFIIHYDIKYRLGGEED